MDRIVRINAIKKKAIKYYGHKLLTLACNKMLLHISIDYYIQYNHKGYKNNEK
jgi:hypothetical protein